MHGILLSSAHQKVPLKLSSGSVFPLRKKTQAEIKLMLLYCQNQSNVLLYIFRTEHERSAVTCVTIQ